jgi:hypothetical protein
VDIIDNFLDGEPRGLFSITAGKARLPILEVKIRFLGFWKYLLPIAAFPAFGPEPIVKDTSLGHYYPSRGQSPKTSWHISGGLGCSLQPYI